MIAFGVDVGALFDGGGVFGLGVFTGVVRFGGEGGSSGDGRGGDEVAVGGGKLAELGQRWECYDVEEDEGAYWERVIVAVVRVCLRV